MESDITDVNLEEAIGFLSKGGSKPAHRVKSSIKTVMDYANAKGLPQDSIFRLIQIVLGGTLKYPQSFALLHSLIPRENVPVKAAICALSKITAGKCVAKIQMKLFRWIVLVYDILSDKSQFHCLYGVLFNYLESDQFSPIICNLLHLMTVECDVTHERISRLMKLQSKIGFEPHLQSLLSKYQMYQPTILLPSGKRANFRTVDKVWKKKIHSVIDRFGPSTDVIPVRGGKKERPLVQEPFYSMVNVEITEIDKPISEVLMGQVRLNDVKNFHDILSNVGNIKMPTNPSSLLAGDWKHLLVTTPEPLINFELGIWFHNQLREHILKADEPTDTGEQLLKILLSLASMFHKHFAVFESFLYKFLSCWNGRDYGKLIFEMISQLQLLDFDILRDYVLTRLRILFLNAPNTQYRCQIIDTLCDLACNYVTVEVHKYAQTHGTQSSKKDFAGLDYFHTIESLQLFVDHLITEGLQLEHGRTRFLFSAIQYWVCVTDAILNHNYPMFFLPSFPVIFSGLFSTSAVCVAGVCTILKNLVDIYINLKSMNVKRDPETVKLFNRYLNDTHNTLWKHRAFMPLCGENTIAYKSLHISQAEELCSMPQDLPPSAMFSIDRHLALAPGTALYLEAMGIDPQEAQVSQFVTEDSYMTHLASHGLGDVVQFIKMLTKRRKPE